MNYKDSVFLSQEGLSLLNKTENYIEVKAKYGPSKITKIPLYLNPQLAFLAATIIGDGHLKKNKLQVTIEVQNKNLILQLIEICKSNFNREFNLLPRIKAGKMYSNILIDSKAIYNLLRFVFEIPVGKKSHIVKVPECIKISDLNTKIAFLNGIMVAEGGEKKNRIWIIYC